MRQLSRVTMSMRELDRLKCIQAVMDGELLAVDFRDYMQATKDYPAAAAPAAS